MYRVQTECCSAMLPGPSMILPRELVKEEDIALPAQMQAVRRGPGFGRATNDIHPAQSP
jgi:hypothetical protein